MANEILNGTKELLGIPLEATEFDNQLVLHINSVLATIFTDLGIGTNLYQITATNGDFYLFEESIRIPLQMYIYMKVRLLFDPPTTSFVLEALKEQLKEQEWRLTQ